ncbi:MAG: molybdopterin converting factor subunit 1 [Candidatus Thermoplasmatota archaeon]
MSGDIEILVKFFAMVRQTVGKKDMTMEIKKGTKVEELVDELIEDYPDLEEIRDILIVSVNKSRADDDRILEEGDEVAIMPPVTGG